MFQDGSSVTDFFVFMSVVAAVSLSFHCLFIRSFSFGLSGRLYFIGVVCPR